MDHSADYLRNKGVYNAYWTRRWRRTHTYSSQGKVRRFRRLADRHGFLRRTGLRVFDQGFGLGLMLFCFDRSCTLAGLEIAQPAVAGAAAEAARLGFKNTDLRVFQPGGAIPKEWLGTYDFVISSHVLEHIANPRPALAELATLLKPGGYACIVVPINEAPGEDANHFCLFTPELLGGMMSAAGLEIVEEWQTDRLWHLMVPVSRRLAARRTFPLKIISAFLNLCGFLPYPILRVIDAVLKPFGLNNRQCFILGRKVG